MSLRNAILIALFTVVATGAMAADKPAVEARQRMEAEAREHSFSTRENITVVRERRDEHPVADVGYQVSQPVVTEQREWSALPSWDSSMKPSVAARQRM